MKNKIHEHFTGHMRTIDIVRRELAPAIEECARLIVAALKGGSKILVMGNGGSAADAQHLAAEFVGRFLRERKALPAIALTTDASVLTAVANDYGFEEIFKRQVMALAVPGDVVIGISTSGNSNNVFHAMTAANEVGCKTVGLLGRDGGTIGSIVDVPLIIPVPETPFIQEAHITVIHLLCALVEEELFGKE
jgi:D-sedoheptulose 7-phosphate isomerase